MYSPIVIDLRKYVPGLVLLAIISIFGAFSAAGDSSGADPVYSQTVRPIDSRGQPDIPSSELDTNGAPGYCTSNGGSTDFEYINGVNLSSNQDGTMKLRVQVFIANPTSCTSGEPCPEYDESPEYVNAWIDWNGDQIWDASEQVMNANLTGYLNINYQGTMTAISQFSPPPSAINGTTWLRVNLGWSADPDVCASSWSWGNVIDQQIHIEQPEIKSIVSEGCRWSLPTWPFSCVLGTPENLPQTGHKVRLTADIEVPAGYELTKCSWTGDLNPGEGKTSNDCLYEFTPATGPGPATNTYGDKNITLNVTYKHTASGTTGQTSKDHNYQVFFQKEADDDNDGEPNWFEYWGDDGAVLGLNASDVIYDQTLGSGSYGYWSPVDDNIHLGDAAAGTHYPSGINVPSGTNCPGGNFGGAQGIDDAAEVLTHERRHETIHHNWDTGGIWNGLADSDDTNHPTKHDRPADDLPDNYENSMGTSSSDVDSCNLETHKSSTYRTYGDNEFDAMRISDGTTGNANNDWANPGKQTPTIFSLLEVQQDQESSPNTKSGLSGPNAPYRTASRFITSPNSIIDLSADSLGNLTGTYSDIGVDTDSDGLFNSLNVSVGVQVDQPSLYNVVAWIEDGAGTEIAWASTQETLNIGVHTVDLFFDGLVIQGSGLDGPYNIVRVELREGDEEYLVDAVNNAYITTPYQSSDFNFPIVGITGNLSDSVIDTDGDSLYNLLRINVDLDVQKVGTYTIVGELEGSESIAVASKTDSLSTGIQSVELDFDGQLIFQRRQDGPYQLKVLRIEDENGDLISAVNNIYATSNYNFSQFQHSGTTINASSYNDQGVDIDGDSDFDYLHIGFQADSDQGGSYRLFAVLKDSEQSFIANIEEDVNLLAGSNVIKLEIPGGPIHTHQTDGPYQITTVSLLDTNGTVVDSMQMAHTTQSYSYADFSPPLVSSVGSYQDYGQDVDGDGLHGYLNVNINVTPGNSGVIIAQGQLIDSITGQEIGWVESHKQMNGGTSQVITLRFNGELILASERNGTFELRNLLVYHTGDPIQSLSISQAHTTDTYNYLDFEPAYEDKSYIYLPIILGN